MNAFLAAATLAVIVSLTGCTTSPLSPSSSHPEGSAAQPSFAQFSDVPIPAKATMDVDHSLVLGHGDAWLGRLVYTTWTEAGGLYDLYKSDMPGFGWQEITSVRASISVQTWQRSDRVATVQIRETTLGSEVILTVAPALNGSGAGASAGAGYAPAPMAAPVPTPVARQPLR